MDAKLFVDNLAPATTGADLLEAFGRFGDVARTRVIVDRATGLSRGFGYVEMSDGADRAIQGLDGTDLGGRLIRVQVASSRGGGAIDRGGFDRPSPRRS